MPNITEINRDVHREKPQRRWSEILRQDQAKSASANDLVSHHRLVQRQRSPAPSSRQPQQTPHYIQERFEREYDARRRERDEHYPDYEPYVIRRRDYEGLDRVNTEPTVLVTPGQTKDVTLHMSLNLHDDVEASLEDMADRVFYGGGGRRGLVQLV